MLQGLTFVDHIDSYWIPGTQNGWSLLKWLINIGIDNGLMLNRPLSKPMMTQFTENVSNEANYSLRGNDWFCFMQVNSEPQKSTRKPARKRKRESLESNIVIIQPKLEPPATPPKNVADDETSNNSDPPDIKPVIPCALPCPVHGIKKEPTTPDKKDLDLLVVVPDAVTKMEPSEVTPSAVTSPAGVAPDMVAPDMVAPAVAPVLIAPAVTAPAVAHTTKRALGTISQIGTDQTTTVLNSLTTAVPKDFAFSSMTNINFTGNRLTSNTSESQPKPKPKRRRLKFGKTILPPEPECLSHVNIQEWMEGRPVDECGESTPKRCRLSTPATDCLQYASTTYLHRMFIPRQNPCAQLDYIPWLQPGCSSYVKPASQPPMDYNSRVTMNTQCGQMMKTYFIPSDYQLSVLLPVLYEFIPEPYKLQGAELWFIARVGNNHYRVSTHMTMVELQSMFNPEYPLEVTVVLVLRRTSQVLINHWTLSARWILWWLYGKWKYMSQVSELWLSCYLVLLSVDSKTR